VNILTKICIVLLVLLNVFAAVVYITKLKTDKNYRLLYEEGLLAKGQAEMARDNADLAVKAAVHEMNEKLKQKELQLREEQAKNATLQEQNQALQMHLTKTEANRDEQATALAALEQNQSESQKIIEALEAQRTSLDKEIDKQLVENVSLQDLLADANQQIQRDHAEKRVLREQLAQREEENVVLIEKLKGLGVTTPTQDEQVVVETPAGTLTATVTAIQSDGLASINIGSVHGVRDGIEMFIYRGAEFVGHLRIEQVDDTESAGVTFNIREGMAVQQGDSVTTNLR